jgi:hypothetical protein
LDSAILPIKKAGKMDNDGLDKLVRFGIYCNTLKGHVESLECSNVEGAIIQRARFKFNAATEEFNACINGIRNDWKLRDEFTEALSDLAVRVCLLGRMVKSDSVKAAFKTVYKKLENFVDDNVIKEVKRRGGL